MRWGPSLILVFVLLGSQLASADQIKYLSRPEQAFDSIMAIAANAKNSIDLTYFIFEPCHASGQVLMDVLEKKAKEGVRVRVLLDGTMQTKEQQANLAADFEKHGIALRFYNNGFRYFITSNFRSHIKLILVDNHTYVTGGRNIADDYFGLFELIDFVDRDLLITGASARQAKAAFNELWNAELTSKPAAHGPFRAWKEVCGKDFNPHANDLREFISLNSHQIDAPMVERSCAKTEFVIDNPNFGRPLYSDRDPSIVNSSDPYMSPERLMLKRVTDGFLKFVRGTQQNLEIENWSYMPVGLLEDAFAELRDKKIPIRVLTNADMDGPGILKPAEEYANNLITARDAIGSEKIVKISMFGSLNHSHALSPQPLKFRLHGKVAVRDGRDLVVSTFNIDPRSYGTNLESMVFVEDCPELAGDLRQGFEEIERAHHYDMEHGLLPPPQDPGILAKIIAIVGLEFL